MPLRSLGPVLFLALFATACGGDSNPTGPGGGNGGVTLINGTFSGTVNGGAFNPLAVSIIYSVQSGIVALGAADIQSRSLGFAFFTNGPGSYTIAQTVGNNANFTESGATWTAAFGSGGSGSLTLTTLTLNRAVGSFNLTLTAATGGATGTRTLAGNFDITY